MPANQQRHIRGFTLIEVLIAIIVISILFAIMLSVQSNVRMVAQRSQCASNLRQIGIGLKLYANEHAGAFPQSTHSLSTFRKDEGWIFQLEDYIGDIDEVRICPAESEERQESIRKSGATSYTVNDLVMDSPTYNNQFRIPQPSQTLLMFVLSEDRSPSLTRDHVHGDDWSDWSAVLSDIEPDRHRTGERVSDRLSGSSTYLYVDGHVEVIEASDFKKQFNGGGNPAVPPL
jgi:prepilin-type N-terminal cleavage/methylation domain-containing protein/prepilin-type processing-associated H-X9-DG protein